MKKTLIQTKIEEKATQANELSRQKYGRLWDAYEAACDLLSNLAVKGGEESDRESKFGPERLSLTASMLQSSFVLENLISSGYYVASIAVLRQHMETLARIIELRSGKKNDNRTPNVSCLPFKLSQNYGRLSEICHTSHDEYLASFAEVFGDEKIASYLPEFRENWSSPLLAIHVGHLVTLAAEIQILQADLYRLNPPPNINSELLQVAEILVEAGVWERL